MQPHTYTQREREKRAAEKGAITHVGSACGHDRGLVHNVDQLHSAVETASHHVVVTHPRNPTHVWCKRTLADRQR
jgi:histidinol-phosphate/aromatic aminotransferase/cobyric acid decarboxylase-like protein